MAEGRDKAEWWRLAALMAHLANLQVDSRKTASFTAATFDPYAIDAPTVKSTGGVNSMEDLGRLFGVKQ